MNTNELERLRAEVTAALTRRDETLPARTGAGSGPAPPRLVTEECVLAARARGEAVIRVAPGAIITPLARDALARFGIAVASALGSRGAPGGKSAPDAEPVRAARTARVAVGVVATSAVEPLLVEALRAAGQAVVRVPGSARKGALLAKRVAGAVASGQADWGVVVDETGLVASAVANRMKGVRAACCNDVAAAKAARERMAANVLCMGADIVAPALIREVLTIWLTADPQISPEIAAILDGMGGEA